MSLSNVLYEILFCFISEHNFSHKFLLIIKELNWVFAVD